MVQRALLLFGILIMLISCSRNEDFESKIEGNFIGTFKRNENISNVELNFEEEGFSGNSETIKFPAICNGKYNRIGLNKIQFTNECVWTAEFDWSLILNGDWNYDFMGNTLVLTNSFGDIYTLTKQ